MTIPGSPAPWSAPQRPPPPATSSGGSTRTLAIVALVLATVSIVGMVGSNLVPAVAFGLFTGGGSFEPELGDWYGIVTFNGAEGAFDVITVNSDDGGMP